MIKINIDKVKNDEFKGHVALADLSDDILKVLHIDRETYQSDTVEVEGYFEAYANNEDDGGIENVTVYLNGTPNGKTLKIQDGWIKEIRDGMTYLSPNFKEIPDVYYYEIPSDSQFDIESISEELVSYVDFHELYYERQAEAAESHYDAIRHGDYD